MKRKQQMSDKKFYLNSVLEAKSFNKKTKSIKIAGYANTTAKDRAGDVILSVSTDEPATTGTSS